MENNRKNVKLVKILMDLILRRNEGMQETVRNVGSLGKTTKNKKEGLGNRDIEERIKTIQMERKDGTSFELEPVLDRNGRIKVETVVCDKGIIRLPRYKIITYKNDTMLVDFIYLEADFNRIQDDSKYKYRVANDVLSMDRLQSTKSNYYGYVGGLDDKCRVYGKERMKTIKNALQMKRNAPRKNQRITRNTKKFNLNNLDR